MPPTKKPPPRSILIVDPAETSAVDLARPLRDMGNDVEIAHDGSSALAVERTFKPDIVIIGLGLQGMDAYTLARFLRAQPGRKVTLVSVADLAKPNERRRAKNAGFSYHLNKPANTDALRLMFVALGIAEETAADAARKLVGMYQRGLITVHEFVLCVIESGAKHDPTEMAQVIPEELLEAVRMVAESPPPDASEVSTDWLGLKLSADAVETRRENVFKGAWRWFRFFHA